MRFLWEVKRILPECSTWQLDSAGVPEMPAGCSSVVFPLTQETRQNAPELSQEALSKISHKVWQRSSFRSSSKNNQSTSYDGFLWKEKKKNPVMGNNNKNVLIW